MTTPITCRYDLELWKGISFDKTVGVARDTATDQRIDLTDYTARATFATNTGTPVLTLTSGDGQIVLNEDGDILLHLTPDDLSFALKPGRWDMKLSDGAATWLILWGTVQISSTITT